jgi:hypothetical protein
MKPYTLDAVDQVEANFNYPNQVQVSMDLFSNPVSLQARLEVRGGFQKARVDSPLQVTSIAVKYGKLIIELEPTQ